MIQIPEINKQKVISLISKVLFDEKKVIFAYLYGSFIESNIARDIDIAVYCKELEDIFSFQVDMKIKISNELRSIGIDLPPDVIDLRVINNADYDFVIEVLEKGILLVNKDPELRTNFIEKVSLNYRINEIVLSEFYK